MGKIIYVPNFCFNDPYVKRELKSQQSDKNDVKIYLINDDRLSPEQELCQDLISIVSVFSSRLHGLDNIKKKIKKICENQKNEF